ncbi:type I restriction-modification enzyme R subunit C-terminal domain-containing protein [Streptomyces prasinus]|uniref:type I restriction-modification enzyme R subunit C-terminal domain-containing protein n=1 Tax=Streptomyces prasinus TaxID=67345 RepID=UPI0036B36526
MNPDNFLVRPHRREIEVFSEFGRRHRVGDDADTAIRDHLLGLPGEFRPDDEEPGEEEPGGEAERNVVRTDFADEQRFKQKARACLLRHEGQPVVRKRRLDEQITEPDPASLEEILLTEVMASAEDLDEVRSSGGLGLFVRGLCGLDRRAAQKAFEAFIADKQLSSRRLGFLTLITDTVARRGIPGLGDLHEDSFAGLAPDGPDDLFTGDELEHLEVVLGELERTARPTTRAA